MAPTYFPGQGADLIVQGGVLSPAFRRDLADLNRQFLELGLAPELASDPRFAWSEPVRAGLLGTDSATRDRMAGCPFALFEIHLPATRTTAGIVPSRVQDGAAAMAPAEPWHARCLAFGHFALFVALRFADIAPLATRIALGLSSAAELRLKEMCPSEVAQLATSPDVIRPRWPAHPRFWAMLRWAVRSGAPSALQWTHCVGICLLGSEFSAVESGPVGPTPRHRPPH